MSKTTSTPPKSIRHRCLQYHSIPLHYIYIYIYIYIYNGDEMNPHGQLITETLHTAKLLIYIYGR